MCPPPARYVPARRHRRGEFDTSQIGPAAQYRGFAVFNKIDSSTWTLTGTSNQSWAVSGGTLIGTTTSASGNIALSNNSVFGFDQNVAGSYSGTISGDGSLTKAGTGKVTLATAQAYTGGTTISAGTLQIGNGGTSGSVLGNITNNAALIFNRSDAVTFGNVISGSGTLEKLGAGTLTLSGINTYTGATTVNRRHARDFRKHCVGYGHQQRHSCIHRHGDGRQRRHHQRRLPEFQQHQHGRQRHHHQQRHT